MNFIQSPTGGAIMAAAGFLLLAALVARAWRSGDSDAKLRVASALLSAGLVVISNLIARTAGLWDSWTYGLHPLSQAGLLFALPAVVFAGVLRGFQWLSRRREHPLLVFGLLAAAIMIPFTVIADLYALGRGALSFGRGYGIAQDVAVGQVFIWMPVLFYTISRTFRPGDGRPNKRIEQNARR